MAGIDSIYQNHLRTIMESGVEEVNQRTGHKTKAVFGLHFTTDLQEDGFPLISLRKLPIKSFIAEQVWFVSGSRKPSDFLNEFTKIWDIFTNPGDVVTVAYGYRWRRHFGRDQLKALVDLLKKDPSSRHGVVVTWDPSSDGLGGISRKNVPCPYTFVVNICNGRLNLHNIVRSNDMILGFGFDVAGFALLAYILADALGVEPGTYAHTISNAHVYDNHYFAAEELMGRTLEHSPIKLSVPKGAFERAEKKDATLVHEIADMIQSQYNPQAAIKGLKIAL